MKIFVLIGRMLFCLIFLTSSIGHFSTESIQYSADKGVPLASILVPFSGVIAAIGALSIIVGYKARLGAFLIIMFLLPVTFIMHPFWVEADPVVQQMQLTMFMKNISMLGAAVLIGYFGSGPMSLDEKYVEDSPLI